MIDPNLVCPGDLLVSRPSMGPMTVRGHGVPFMVISVTTDDRPEASLTRCRDLRTSPLKVLAFYMDKTVGLQELYLNAETVRDYYPVKTCFVHRYQLCP